MANINFFSMRTAQKHPKKNLSFRALLGALADAIGEIDDLRNPVKIKYSFVYIYLSAFALFLMQDASLLEFQRRLEDWVRKNNLRTLFTIGWVNVLGLNGIANSPEINFLQLSITSDTGKSRPCSSTSPEITTALKREGLFPISGPVRKKKALSPTASS